MQRRRYFLNIAKKYNTTENEIAELNDIKLDEPIKPGKCLILEKSRISRLILKNLK